MECVILESSIYSLKQIGDRVGVGCMVDSCRECSSCGKGLEQYCAKGMVATYNSQVHIGLEDVLNYSTPFSVTAE